MLVSIIILNYNGKNCLENTLKSVSKLNFPKKDFEVIVVDNNSKDDSWKIVKKYRTKLIRNKENFGFAEGNNVGIRKAKGDFIVLFNNDLIVDKNWLKELVPIIQADKKIGAIGGKIYYGKTKELWFGGAKFNFGGIVNHKYLGDKAGYSDYMVGAAVMFRKSVLKEVGLFDKKFFLYSEDIDLGSRIRKKGYTVFYSPEAISYHMIEKNRSSSYQEYYEQRNRPYLCFKNYDYLRFPFIIMDLIFFFPFFWLNRVLRNSKKLKFWKETLRARRDSIKMILGD